MKIKYLDLINQTYVFPQAEFKLKSDDSTLMFHDIDLMKLIKTYGTPIKFTYLPKISDNINMAKSWFNKALKAHNYPGDYYYCYCTKSAHFSFVMNEALKNDIHIETSSDYDINIVRALIQTGKITKNHYIICNGFKKDQYLNNIVSLINDGYKKCISIIDNYEEFSILSKSIDNPFEIGIRIASEEEPKFEFYTSRLGIGSHNIIPFYNEVIKKQKNARLKMLHFFINTGIKDDSYYWNEMIKCVRVYTQLKSICPTLDSLNIGGGFPIKNSLAFSYDYEYIINEIVNQIKRTCKEANVPPPHIFTEFGSFTVGESGGAIYEILYQKQQNDREKWNMINSSFITTIPDTWTIHKRFIMLPINRWNDEYERVLLGGLTCDGDDYYNSEQNINAIYLPKYNKNNPLYIGFFNTGAYQDNISGFGGIQHCLIPSPQHILIDKNQEGILSTKVFSQEQDADSILKILGYNV